jgi:uncharacterized protein
MLMLKQKLRDELKQSMLARDALKTSVLRMLLSALNYYEIQKGGAGYEATDEDTLSVIQKEAKQRRDSIEEFKRANRQELVDKETKELEMLQIYLPQQMTEEEIKTLVKEAVNQTGAKTMTDMGKVMGALMPKVKGKADGGLVSKIVRESLS